MAEAIGYHRAVSVEDALQHLRDYGDDARIVCGGTAMAILMRQGLVQPGVLVSIGRLAELQTTELLPNGNLRIGAASKLRRIEHDLLLRQASEAVAEAVAAVATPRIRNMATIGGGLAHADPAQDPAIALAAADATVIVQGETQRRIPAAEFARDYYETALAPGEMVIAVEIPARPAVTGSAYLKFLPRSAEDYGVVTAAAMIDLADGICSSARLTLGAVSNTPVTIDVTADLVGRRPDENAIAAASNRARDLVDPIEDVRGSAAYKRAMAVVFARRALTKAVQRAFTSEGNR